MINGIDRLLDATYQSTLTSFVPFSVDAAVVGWLRSTFAQELRDWPDVFEHDQAGSVHLHPRLTTREARTRAIGEVVQQLESRGLITGRRSELYAVATSFAAPPLFHLERAAARAFGIASYAVHVNGVVAVNSGWSMWLGRRSLSKPIDPGMQDNLIGGGLAAGLTVRDTLVKEAWEEAGLTTEQVAGVKRGRRVHIRREVPEGLQVETIFVHDLVLPATIVPRNQDGEVSAFECLPVADVIRLLQEGDRITPDASLVLLDWLDRRRIVRLRDKPQARVIFTEWSGRQ
ncbi:MAG: DUF4743 domain-containing protein [Betaproteobacteria bacterium]